MMQTDPQNKQRGSIHGIIIDFHLQGKSKNRAYARTVRYCWRDKDVCFLRLCVGLVCALFFLMTTLLEQCSAWVSSWGGRGRSETMKMKWEVVWERACMQSAFEGGESVALVGVMIICNCVFNWPQRWAETAAEAAQLLQLQGRDSCKLCCCCRSRHFTLGGDSLMTCENIYELNYGKCWLITN